MTALSFNIELRILNLNLSYSAQITRLNQLKCVENDNSYLINYKAKDRIIIHFRISLKYEKINIITQY